MTAPQILPPAELPSTPDRPADGTPAEDMVVLEDVVKYFRLPRRKLTGKPEHVHSVDGVNLRVRVGEVLGLVGESGSGKSTLARVLLRLVRATSGSIRIAGSDVTRVKGADVRRLRRTAQLVFQDPHAAMDPRMTIGDSLRAVLDQHGLGSKEERQARVSAGLAEVGLDYTYLDRYPSQCTGSQ